MVAAIDRIEFDYTALDIETRIRIQQRTSEIKSIARVSWIEIGTRLIEVKAALPHGSFQAWIAAELEPELGISDRTARSMMAAIEAFGGKMETVSDLPIQQSAAYELASAPQSARDEAIDRATAGEPITKKVAKEIIAKHQPGSAIEHQGQTLTVEASDDIVVTARGVGGETVTLLTSELLPDPSDTQSPTPDPTPPKPAPIESLSLQLESALARIVLLEDWMRRSIAFVPPPLASEAKKLLE